MYIRFSSLIIFCLRIIQNIVHISMSIIFSSHYLFTNAYLMLGSTQGCHDYITTEYSKWHWCICHADYCITFSNTLKVHLLNLKTPTTSAIEDGQFMWWESVVLQARGLLINKITLNLFSSTTKAIHQPFITLESIDSFGILKFSTHRLTWLLLNWQNAYDLKDWMLPRRLSRLWK